MGSTMGVDIPLRRDTIPGYLISRENGPGFLAVLNVLYGLPAFLPPKLFQYFVMWLAFQQHYLGLLLNLAMKTGPISDISKHQLSCVELGFSKI